MAEFKAPLRANLALCVLAGVLVGLWVAPPLPISVIATMGPLWLIVVWHFGGARALLGCGAVVVAWLHATDYQLNVAAAFTGGERVVSGCVASVPRVLADGFSFRFREGDSGRLLQLRTYDPQYEFGAGECHSLLTRLKPPHGQLNQGQFDRSLWLMRERIAATGYVAESSLNRRLPDSESSFRLLKMRARLAAAINARLGESPVSGIFQGLTVGVREQISDAQWRVFRGTGTVHLMAISGLHVTLVAGAAWVFARWLPVPTGSPAGRARTSAIMAAIGYAVLAGWTVPASRAALMLVVMAVLTAGRRHAATVQGMWVALCIALLADPFSVFGSGFWMSYLAVALLLTAPPVRPSRRDLIHKVSHYAQQLGAAQWRLSSGLAVPSILLFGGLAPLSPLLNLAAIPLFSVLLPILLLAVCLALAVPAAQGSLSFVSELTEFGLALLRACADGPGGNLAAPASTAAMMVLAVGCGLQLPRCPGCRLAGLALVSAAWLLPDVFRAPPLRVDVLDVGQGTAAVIRTPGYTVLLDTGPGWRGGNAGLAVVLPFLRSQRVRRLDLIIVSHSDNDHSGGLNDIRAAYPEAVIVRSRPQRAAEFSCRRGASWRRHQIEFVFLHPQRAEGWSDNDASCVLLVRAADDLLLFPGDIERHAEAVLAARYPSLQAALVIAPHHGSSTSSSAPFIAATTPDFLVYTAGYRNRWGFPAASVARAWAEHAECQLNTATSGALSFSWTPRSGLLLEGAEVSRWRRPWALRAQPDELCLDA